MYDGNFNVTGLIEPDGDMVERYMYDPYGNVSFLDGSWGALSASAYDNPILYCGYRYDPESGLYQVRYRYYHPTLGTWTARDKIGYVDGMSLYEYCRGMPNRQTDPSGLAAGVPTGAGPKYEANGDTFTVYSGIMLQLSNEETASIVKAGGGYTISKRKVVWGIRVCPGEGASDKHNANGSEESYWINPIRVEKGKLADDRTNYYDAVKNFRTEQNDQADERAGHWGGTHSYEIVAGNTVTTEIAAEYTVMLMHDLNKMNTARTIKCTYGSISSSWEYTIHAGTDQDFRIARGTVETRYMAEKSVPITDWTDPDHKRYNYSKKKIENTSDPVVAEGEISVKISWTYCNSNLRIFVTMFGTSPANGMVFRPDRRAEEMRGTTIEAKPT
jgi:RHS repeat-associated protein